MRPLLVLSILLFCNSVWSKGLRVEIEAGAVWQHRNDVQITPQSGTLVSFDEFDGGPFFHYRSNIFYDINEKHGIRAVIAPFSISVTGTPKFDVNYNNQTFNANQPLTVDFRFNSYRLGYTYRLYGDDQGYFKIGLTGKIRDAEITFTQNNTSSSYDNVGFVPLLYYSWQFPITQNWYFYSDADFAAAPQGRAIDLTIKLRRILGANSTLGFGYRTLEGGADNDKVLTFSWLSYAVVDLALSF